MFPGAALPVDEFLTLRVGCIVTMLADDPAGGYAYGEVGVFLGRCGAALKVVMSDGRELAIEAKTWSSHSYEPSEACDGKPALRKRVSGTFVQFPLLAGRNMWMELAYGRTLPRVHLQCPETVGDREDFPVCQLYVGISRTPSLGHSQVWLSSGGGGILCESASPRIPPWTRSAHHVHRSGDADVIVCVYASPPERGML